MYGRTLSDDTKRARDNRTGEKGSTPSFVRLKVHKGRLTFDCYKGPYSNTFLRGVSLFDDKLSSGVFEKPRKSNFFETVAQLVRASV